MAQLNNIKNSIILLLALIAIFFLVVPANASSLQDIYTEVAAKYPEEIQKLKDNNLSETDILNYIGTAETTLAKRNRLNKDNIADEVANTLFTVYIEQKHDKFFQAVFKGWNLTEKALVDAYLDGGSKRMFSLLPKSLKEIGMLVSDRLLSTTPAGGINNPPVNPVSNGNDNGVNINLPPVATPVGGSKKFIDLEQHWARHDIELMAVKGYVNGVTPTMFSPNKPITRAEFSAILGNVLRIKYNHGVIPFEDVPTTAWYYKSIAASYQAGLVKGISTTQFAPSKTISRQEMAAMIANALASKGKLNQILDPNQINNFSDVSDISPWATKSVALVVANGILGGKSGNKIAPKVEASRAEATVMLYRVYQRIQ